MEIFLPYHSLSKPSKMAITKKLRHPLTNRMVPISYEVTKQVCNAYTTDRLPEEWLKAGKIYQSMGYDIKMHEPYAPVYKPHVHLVPLATEPISDLKDTLRMHYNVRMLRNNTILYEEKKPSKRSASYYIMGQDIEVIREYIQDLLLFYPQAGYGTLWRPCGTYASDGMMVWYINHGTSCD